MLFIDLVVLWCKLDQLRRGLRGVFEPFVLQHPVRPERGDEPTAFEGATVSPELALIVLWRVQTQLISSPLRGPMLS